MKSIFVALAAIIATIGGSAIAQNRADTETVAIEVATADLNMSTPEGVATFERRIAGALRRVCPRPDTNNLVEARYQQRCLAQARAAMSAQVASIRADAFAANTSGRVPVTATLAP